ncbi:MAG: double zinc ribbon domain-containing protein [Maritimibacter sp.]
MQTAVNLIFPASCSCCGEAVEEDAGLCGACWVDTWFLSGHICDACGAPLPGDSDGAQDHCDDCMSIGRPWDQGRAALLYKGNGRRLALSLKHADRPDLARPAANWMRSAGADILLSGAVLVPVPLHWTRLFKRRYNQSVELARALGQITGLHVAPQSLIRTRRTESQVGKGYDGRFANIAGAIEPHPSKSKPLEGRSVVLIDDVMTSGATLACAAEAATKAGAAHVHTLVLARATKDT